MLYEYIKSNSNKENKVDSSLEERCMEAVKFLSQLNEEDFSEAA